jgi:hypothetical protein
MARKVTVAPRRLTEEVLRTVPVGRRITDKELAGFSAQRNRDGIVYKVKRDYRAPGAEKPETFNYTFTAASLDDARVEAVRLLGLMKQGINPSHKGEAQAASWPAGVPSVEQAYKDWFKDIRARGGRESTIESIQYRLDRYIPDWKEKPITDIKRSTARARHEHILFKHGPRVANQTLGDFGTAWRLAAKLVDDEVELPSNPADAVTKAKEKGESHVMSAGELPQWWEDLAIVKSPVRRAMLALGLLSGLRPLHLKEIRRSYIQAPQRHGQHGAHRRPPA